MQVAASACLGVGMGRLFLEYVEAPAVSQQGGTGLRPARSGEASLSDRLRLGLASAPASLAKQPVGTRWPVTSRLLSTQAPCVYVCLSCRTHLSAHDSIISKAFQGRHGRAYLFGDVVNINSGPTENRLLLTGLHVVHAC